MTSNEDKIKRLNELSEEMKNLYVELFEDIAKDLEILEVIKDHCSIVIEGENRYFFVRIKEYDYLRRPIEDFDKVKRLVEK